jgi:hypothetical protein
MPDKLSWVKATPDLGGALCLNEFDSLDVIEKEAVEAALSNGMDRRQGDDSGPPAM